MVGYPIGPMTPLHERVEIIMRDHPELTVGTLAKAAGVSSSAVSQWKTSRGSISAKAAARLNERYGYRIVWLTEGKGPRRAPPSSAQVGSNQRVTTHLADKNDPPGVIPVVGVMYMTSGGSVERFVEEEGAAAGGIRVHSDDPDACAVRLMGESVGVFRAGWYVLIEPAAPLVPGEPVLLTLKDGKRVLGELLSRAAGGISLLGITGGARMAFIEKDVETIHAVSAVVSPSKFVA